MQRRSYLASLGFAVVALVAAPLALAWPAARAQDAEKVTVDFDDANVRTVVKMIADYVHRPIVVDKDVHSNVSIHLKEVPWRTALDAIAKAGGCEVLETDKEIVVRTIPLVDVDADKKPLAEVIAEVAKKASRTIVVDKSLAGDVTCHLKKTPWREAAVAIARTLGPDADLRDVDGKLVLGRFPEEGAKVAFREYPIGDEVEREVEHLRVAAVWLPPVTMDHEHGHPAAGPHVVHLECDIHATRGNENGFAVGDWIPYLTIKYRIEPADKDLPAGALEGTLMPMVAKDGPHYGATIAMPATGHWKLTYALEPPSSNGLGRHTDSITGVADWWKPFETTYAWDYKGIPSGEPGKR